MRTRRRAAWALVKARVGFFCLVRELFPRFFWTAAEVFGTHLLTPLLAESGGQFQARAAAVEGPRSATHLAQHAPSTITALAALPATFGLCPEEQYLLNLSSLVSAMWLLKQLLDFSKLELFVLEDLQLIFQS